MPTPFAVNVCWRSSSAVESCSIASARCSCASQHRDLFRALLRGFEAAQARARFGHLRGRIVQVGLLQVGIEREQRRAGRDRVALAHVERLDPPGLVRPDEHEVALDPALQAAVVRRRTQAASASASATAATRAERVHRRPPGKQDVDMRAHHRVDVERLELVEHRVPHDADQHRRDDQLREARQRVVRKFAALGRALQGSAARSRSTRSITSR